MNDSLVQELLNSKEKPIAVTISSDDIQRLYAAQTSPFMFMQCILAKLKDAGAPIEGALTLKLAHGQVYKMKTNPMVEQDGFQYMWLPEQYVHSMNVGSA